MKGRAYNSREMGIEYYTFRNLELLDISKFFHYGCYAMFYISFGCTALWLDKAFTRFKALTFKLLILCSFI